MATSHEQQPLFEEPFDGPSLRVPILLLIAIWSRGSVSAVERGGRIGKSGFDSHIKFIITLPRNYVFVTRYLGVCTYGSEEIVDVASIFCTCF